MTTIPNQQLRELTLAGRAWPFEEARKLLKRFETSPPSKGYCLFETGYGPSGLPHIGTFGEVARTTMVRRAFMAMSDIPTKLIAFSDDMDGLRKVPDNIPEQEMVRSHIGKPLTAIPDPYGTHESFGHHMHARLRAFLDRYGFEYEFKSATDSYKSGEFDQALLTILKHYDAVMAIMLPTLGEERQQSYSPFLPVCPRTGKVLQVAITLRDEAGGTISYQDPETGETVTTPVTGGHCKLQWKADWAMRWLALDVDYEMCGKDLIPSYDLSSKIVRALKHRAPDNMVYELFLDEQGQKISKSKGNGLTIDEWLTYAPEESLAYYMFQQPTRAKRLYFDVIPKCVDEYLSFLDKFPGQEPAQQVENPVWHIHGGNPPKAESPLSFSLLLNLASACNPEHKGVLWGFISRYVPGATPETAPMLDRLAAYAVRYYHDFVKPTKRYRDATPEEAAAMRRLEAELRAMPATATAEEFQQKVYDIGKEAGFAELKLWFQALYEVLLGQPQGPRMGSFIALFGRDESCALISEALSRKAAA
ncbi:lysine--tRNA ligase [bacterium]|nr:lysine--tRNA ligase [bacterium]